MALIDDEDQEVMVRPRPRIRWVASPLGSDTSVDPALEALGDEHSHFVLDEPLLRLSSHPSVMKRLSMLYDTIAPSAEAPAEDSRDDDDEYPTV